MTTLKALVAAALLSVFAVSSFAQAPAMTKASHNAVQRHYVKHHHHHHHHAPVRR
jgi:Spy/CpxP family protein refolding chaperone